MGAPGAAMLVILQGCVRVEPAVPAVRLAGGAVRAQSSGRDRGAIRRGSLGEPCTLFDAREREQRAPPRPFVVSHGRCRSVFFGPDSYRFAALLDCSVRGARRCVDVGCGTGVGGLVLAGRVSELVLADVNPAALELAAVNAALSGVSASAISFVLSDVLAAVEGDIDLLIANPPYLVDEPGRLYRDGGGARGLELAARIVEESLSRLQGGGQLVLYTGTPIVAGENLLAERLRPLRAARESTWTWCELEPDVFGEELERPAYRDVERLAVVSLIVTAAY